MPRFMNLVTLQIIAASLIIIGLILNTYKNRLCWPIWILGNGALICLYSISGLYVIVLLQVILIIINIIGWFKWKT